MHSELNHNVANIRTGQFNWLWAHSKQWVSPVQHTS